MRCRQAKKLLFDHIDGVISESDRVGLERHLAECRGCEEHASALARSLDLLHRLPAESPSENFNWKLRLRLAREKQTWRGVAEVEAAWRKVWNTRFAVGAVSAFLAVLLGGGAFLMSGGERTGAGERFARSAETPARESAAGRNGRGGAPSWALTPFVTPQSNGIVSQPVATGATRSWNVVGNARPSGPLIDVDSLRVRYIESRLEYQRIRSLEQQIEALYAELDKCNPRRDE